MKPLLQIVTITSKFIHQFGRGPLKENESYKFKMHLNTPDTCNCSINENE